VIAATAESLGAVLISNDTRLLSLSGMTVEAARLKS
jgi:hypothetical protein